MIVQEREIVDTLPDAGLPADWRLDTIPGLVGKDGLFLDGDWIESKDQDPNGDVRLIQLADIGDGFYRNRSDRYLTHDRAVKLGCTFLKKGDVLIARMPDPLGRACIFPGDSKKAVTAVDVCIVRPNREDVDSRWLMYFVNAPSFRSAVASLQSGSTRKRISRSNLAKIQLPVPPTQQQQRIVAEIEKQFSRLDESVANLKRVKANLIRHKAAVLKAAVEGRLVETEAELARREGRSYETGTQLLQSILNTRRSQWKRKGKYKEPSVPDKTVPGLTEGWVWATVSQLLVEPIANGLSIKESAISTNVRALRLSAMSDKGFDYSDHRFLPTKLDQVADIIIREGDVFVSRGNGSLHLVGRSTVAQPPPFDVIFPDTMMRLRLAEPIRVTAWFQTIWSNATVRHQIERRVKTTAGIYKISQPELADITIPLPPFAEQHRIVSEVDRRLSLVQEVETQVDVNLKRAERLRQAILAMAFSGKLA